MPADLLSVVVPARNAASTIEGQLAALAEQRYAGPWEVVVADNGSSDGTADVVMAWSDRLPSIRVVDASTERGVGHARNVGTKMAGGRLLAYCDADDVVGEDWVASMAQALDQHGIVTGPIDLARLNAAATYSWRGGSGWRQLPDWLAFLPSAFGDNLGVRREAFEAVGGFRNFATGQDYDFVWRVQLAGFPLFLAPGALVHRRLPATLTAYARRQFAYNRGEPLLFRHFRSHGMPRSSSALAIAKSLAVVAASPLLLFPGHRYRWVTAASTRVGRLAGSWEHRVLYM